MPLVDSYVQQTTTNQSFRDKLVNRFAPHDWVRVINVDNETFQWIYMPEENETISFDNGSVPMKNTFRKPPQIWELASGESEVLQGSNAYLFMEGLYKKVTAKKVIERTPDQEKHQARNFNWTDSLSQDQFIDKVYLGREALQFTMPASREDVSKQQHETTNQPVKKS